MIKKNEASKPHWNYFLALEQDLENVSRFIEFCEPNLQVFSIELAHLLFAAASEVDVLAKCICEVVAPKDRSRDINDYRAIFMEIIARQNNSGVTAALDVSKIKIRIPRYGLDFVPWENWAKGSNPDWWQSYNKVKHERDKYFHQATLHNAINALGALLILNFIFYRLMPQNRISSPRTVIEELTPESMLLKLPYDYLGEFIHNKLSRVQSSEISWEK